MLQPLCLSTHTSAATVCSGSNKKKKAMSAYGAYGDDLDSGAVKANRKNCLQNVQSSGRSVVW